MSMPSSARAARRRSSGRTGRRARGYPPPLRPARRHHRSVRIRRRHQPRTAIAIFEELLELLELLALSLVTPTFPTVLVPSKSVTFKPLDDAFTTALSIFSSSLTIVPKSALVAEVVAARVLVHFSSNCGGMLVQKLAMNGGKQWLWFSAKISAAKREPV